MKLWLTIGWPRSDQLIRNIHLEHLEHLKRKTNRYILTAVSSSNFRQAQQHRNYIPEVKRIPIRRAI